MSSPAALIAATLSHEDSHKVNIRPVCERHVANIGTAQGGIFTSQLPWYSS